MPLSYNLPSAIKTIILGSCLLHLTPAHSMALEDVDHAKHARTMSLSATGSIDTKPDMASINTGIETVAVRAADALDDNNDVMARMMKSLKQAGLADRDIATTQFSVQPRYERLTRRRNQTQPHIRKIIGYTVTNSLRITVRKLDELGTILDRLISLGANRFSGIQFGIQDTDNALDEARKVAMQKVIDVTSRVNIYLLRVFRYLRHELFCVR